MGAPRKWADLRSKQRALKACVDPSYSSAVGCHTHRASFIGYMWWCICSAWSMVCQQASWVHRQPGRCATSGADQVYMTVMPAQSHERDMVDTIDS